MSGNRHSKTTLVRADTEWDYHPRPGRSGWSIVETHEPALEGNGASCHGSRPSALAWEEGLGNA